MKQNNNTLTNVLTLGLQEIRMLLIENAVAQMKHTKQINDEQYNVFREVADHSWDRWGRRMDKVNKNNKPRPLIF